jgi:hypothetical protein
MSTAAVLTVLAGGTLYWRDSQGLTSLWMWAGSGIGYGIGGAAGLVGLVFGIMFGISNKRMAMVGAEIKDGKPTPEQASQLQKFQGILKVAAPVHVTALIIAALFMSVARYLVF